MANKTKLFVLFSLFIITVFSVADANIFTIVPETQYVYLNHNVTFECATNLTGYALSFNYIFGGGTISSTLKKSNLTDGGIKVSTTFIVTSILNGTGVRCIADHSVNTTMLTSLAYVYAQGPPGAVSNLWTGIWNSNTTMFITVARSTSVSTGIISTTSISNIMGTSTPSDKKTGPDMGIIVGLVIIGIIIILVIIVIVLAFLIIMLKKRSNKKITNGPIPAPKVQSDVTYSELLCQSTNNKNNKHPSQSELKELVTSKVAHKWFPIDIGLGMSGEQLEEIRENSNDIPDHCLGNLFYEWEQNPHEDKPFTWGTLLKVLRSVKVGEESFTKELEEHFSM